MSFEPAGREASFLDALERRFGRYAIPGLVQYILFLNVIGFAFQFAGSDAVSIVQLDRAAVLRGEVWRLVTHVFLPPPVHPLLFFFFAWVLLLCGRALEAEWGAFRFNVFFLLGGFLATVAGFFFGQPGVHTSYFLHETIFLAFATIHPNFVFHLFLILPVKVKWLAWITVAYFALEIVTGSIASKAMILVCLGNYFVFFWSPFLDRLHHRGRRERFKRQLTRLEDQAFHRCAVCDRTERDDPTLEFRVCPDCQGELDYCIDHLDGHEHR